MLQCISRRIIGIRLRPGNAGAAARPVPALPGPVLPDRVLAEYGPVPRDGTRGEPMNPRSGMLRPFRPSLFRTGAALRLAVALALSGALWGAIAWALA